MFPESLGVRKRVEREREEKEKGRSEVSGKSRRCGAIISVSAVRCHDWLGLSVMIAPRAGIRHRR